MNSENIEKRSHYRLDFANPFEYVLADGPAAGAVKGATLNCSKTGICFFTFSPVADGDEITIVNSLLPMPHKKGRVCWAKKVDDDFYKVGLIFEDE